LRTKTALLSDVYIIAIAKI